MAPADMTRRPVTPGERRADHAVGDRRLGFGGIGARALCRGQLQVELGARGEAPVEQALDPLVLRRRLLFGSVGAAQCGVFLALGQHRQQLPASHGHAVGEQDALHPLGEHLRQAQ